MKLGLDKLLSEKSPLLQGKRIGILAHQASLNSDGVHILDLLIKEKNLQVTTLFGPEHGFETKAQDMEAVAGGKLNQTEIPIYSLYGATENELRPTPEMLENVDILIIDLQDVGARYYTYIWTMVLCMEECAKLKKKVIVCDRPNPINGITIEGDINHSEFLSFVGLYPLPVRHGMTIGEIARYMNDTEDIHCNLEVIEMDGWKREWHWDATGLNWTNPSPNMTSAKEALVYPGTCLIEATNVSEGRGTKYPLQVAGAPWINASQLCFFLGDFELLGIQFKEIVFKPDFQKYAGQECNGVFFSVTNRKTFKSYETGVALISALYHLYKNKGFEWRDEPYEFVSGTPAIDLLTGSSHVREAIESGLPFKELQEWIEEPPESFLKRRGPYLLY